MTEEKLKEIERRVEKVAERDCMIGHGKSLIVLLRDSFPKLIAEVRRLRGQNDRHMVIQDAVTRINKDLLEENGQLRELLREASEYVPKATSVRECIEELK